VAASGLDISVTDYGALGNGQTLCTEAFQSAVSAIADAGGGILRVPAGDYFTGPITLTSNFVLWLARGATLKSDTDRRRLKLIAAIPAYGPDPTPNDFDPRKKQADLRDAIPRVPALLNGVGLNNVTITGENGTLDGQGVAWWRLWLEEPLDGRPHLIQFEKSRNIRLLNVTLVNPGFWAVHLWLCEYVHVRFLSVLVIPWDPPVRPTNTDGVNPDSSQHVLIEDSYFQTGDDAVAIKSGWDCFGRAVNAPSKNITIRRVKVKQTRGCNAAGIAVGSEMSGGIDGVLIEDCHFESTGAAVEVKVGTGRGGYVRNVRARDLTIGHTARGAIVVMATYPEGNPFCKERNPPAPTVHNVTFERIKVTGPTRGQLVQLQGTKEVFLHNVSIYDLQVTDRWGWGLWSCQQVSGVGRRNQPAACMELNKGQENRVGTEHLDNGGPQRHRPPSEARPASNVGKLWRNDGRCGFDFRAEEGQPGVCPTPEQFLAEDRTPDRKYADPFLRNAPCCALSGWCGAAEQHCNCYGCLDFRVQDSRFPTEPLRNPHDFNKLPERSDKQRHGSAWWDARSPQRPWRQTPPARPTPPPAVKKPKRPMRVREELKNLPGTNEAAAARLRQRASPADDSDATGRDEVATMVQEDDFSSVEESASVFAEEEEDEDTANDLAIGTTLPIASEPPVRGLITSLVFALCIFLCCFLIRGYLPAARKHCLCLTGLACLAISPYIGFLHEQLYRPAAMRAGKAHPMRPGQYARSPPSWSAPPKPKAGSKQRADRMAKPSRQPPSSQNHERSVPSPKEVSPLLAKAGGACGTSLTVTPLDFGAVGDGSADDTEAVGKCLAYVGRCPLTEAVLGPRGYLFLVRPGVLNITLNNVRLRFEGELVGPSLNEWNSQFDVWPAGSCAYGEVGCSVQKQSPEFVRSRWTLLHIRESSNLSIEGPGGIRAPGRSFWEVRNKRPEVVGYCLLKLERSTDVRVRGIELTDSPMYQFVIMHSRNVDIHGLSIVVNDLTVGEHGPHNTDGVSIIASENVRLTSSEVESGDDNVVIKEGSRGIVVENLSLFRGKGVSIGSLGERATEDQIVSDIVFRNVSLYYSMHGARIKTWIGSQGYVRNVTFDRFNLENVNYGILIDQKYCPLSQRPEGCGKPEEAFQKQAIAIEDVRFRKFHGTFMTEDKKVACVRCKRVTVKDAKMRRSPDAPPPPPEQFVSWQYDSSGNLVR
jgi:polygalacturonase